ncbi:LytR/AlgR family response regulator transcription factor [Catalinimonas niigatensis]|uniref:LytR/AlgR family response regulator transcription factor n=1 Tax=Catalinimonas niigatensis TaxID=1397264 RepID=UPI0026657272|nr:LytTR family DNA-binding domain-containing protein [Catalinimonas niigatensis]WPP51762.1 LytTR family DNA-binding domain-containing protein [Catalinimonas niigatensis]
MPLLEKSTTLHCLVVDDQPASSEVLCRYIERTKGLQLAGSFSDGLVAFDYLKTSPDLHLIFLDVEMPMINGFDLLAMINQHDSSLLPLVILTTGHAQYAAQGYYFDRVAGFLQKVVSYPSFLSMVEKARRVLTENDVSKIIHDQILAERDMVFIKTSFNRKERYERIDLNELLFIKSDRNYIHLVTDKNEYLVKNSLSDIEKQLFKKSFIRVHKSYLVNLARIRRVEVKQLFMDGGKTVPISETYRSNLVSRLSELSIEDK